jgi:hypothetical protein
MVVTINGRALDITLERERTLGELLAGVERWLEEGGFSLSGIAVNGEAVELDAVEKACSRELDEIERVDIVASTWTELLRAALTETSRALEERERSGADGVPTISATWNASASASFLSGRDGELHALIRDTLDGKIHDIGGTIATIRDRINEIDDPKGALADLTSVLEPIAVRLEALPLELQTGKDALAAATLADFASLATRLFRLVPLLRACGIDLDEAIVDGNVFRSYIDELGTALKELTTAYEGGDAVLVGDLAEYELAPRLRALAGALERALASAA